MRNDFGKKEENLSFFSSKIGHTGGIMTVWRRRVWSDDVLVAGYAVE
jgi:hypothetical protein